jgi:hypothetical protein
MLAEETLAASAAKYKFTDFRNAGQDECQARILEGAGALNRLGSLFSAQYFQNDDGFIIKTLCSLLKFAHFSHNRIGNF